MSAYPTPPGSINSFARERELEAKSPDTLAQYSDALGSYQREVAAHLGATLPELHAARPDAVAYLVNMAAWVRLWEGEEARHEQIEIQAGLIPTPRPSVMTGSFLAERPVQ